MPEFSNTSLIINMVYVVIWGATVIGGLIAYRKAIHRAIMELEREAGEIQSRVIAAQKNEIDTLKDRMDSLEEENLKLKRNLNRLIRLFSKRGVTIQIDDEIISISDEKGTVVSHIQEHM